MQTKLVNRTPFTGGGNLHCIGCGAQRVHNKSSTGVY